MSDSFIEFGGYKIKRNPQREQKHVAEEFVSVSSKPDNSNDEVNQQTQETKHITPRNLTFQYEDHTADVRVRARGNDIRECLEALAIGMVNYMSDRELIDCVEMREIDVTEDTLDSAIFHFLDEILFLYGSEYFMTNRVDIKICSRAVSAADGTELQELFDIPDDSQESAYRIQAECWGENFDHSRHAQGTEVKAITMHDMSLHFVEDGVESVVLLDI